MVSNLNSIDCDLIYFYKHNIFQFTEYILIFYLVIIIWLNYALISIFMIFQF